VARLEVVKRAWRSMTIGVMLYQDFFFYVYLILSYTYARRFFLPILGVAILFNLYALWRIRRRKKWR
jgi:hypothetical protein